MTPKPSERLGAYFRSRREKGKAGLPTMSVTLDRGLVLRDSIERKMETNLSPDEHLRVYPGDIAYNMMRMWQGASGMAEADGIVSPAYVVLAPKPNVDPLFASYLFKTSEMIHRFWAFSYGLTDDRLRLYPRDFTLIPATIPPFPEQQKIAEILGTWDKAIKTTEALLANARTQKRALMQSLLTGTRRFPGFENHPWREVRLGEVAAVDRNSLGSKTPNDHEFEYISLTNVEPGYIVEPLTRLTFEEAPSRARRLVSVGDILMSTVRPNLQGFAPITPRFAACVASTGFAVVSPGKNVSGSYLFHYLFSDLMTTQLDALVVGSNYPAINSSDVKQLKINLPILDEQKRIGVILDDCDQDIRQLEKEADHLRTEKKSLMQQLLTGKRRVVV